ncbi:MAG: hypothetical protein E6713_07655, partial [Sporomusaceae bacterium]|nr:hypothetical protein [Sporomusaceae bacterium]
IGSGQVLFARKNKSGQLDPIRHLGNVPKFDMKPEVTTVEKKSSMDAAKSVLDEAVTEKKLSVDLTLEEVTPANLALAVYGDEGVVVQAAKTARNKQYKSFLGTYISVGDYNFDKSTLKVKRATALPAAVGAAAPYGTITGDGTVTSGGSYTGTSAEDYYVTISAPPNAAGSLTGCKMQWKKGLAAPFSADVTVTAAPITIDAGVQVTFAVSGTETFVAGDTWKISVTPAVTEFTPGDDFFVDDTLARSGMIQIPADSSIPDAADVLIDYDVPAMVIPKISGLTSTTIRGYLLFLGDPAKGRVYNGEFWDVTIKPNGNVPFIGTDYASFEVTVTCMEDKRNHPDEPFGRIIDLTEARV